METAQQIYPGVNVDPQILAGTPVIAGTRVPVATVIGHLAAGDTTSAVMANYDLSEEQIRAALGYASSPRAWG
jgi:uncharacterized protein (DUF433 family)